MKFFHLSFVWVVFTVTIIYRTIRLWPLWIKVLNVAVMAALLQFTMFQYIVIYWYVGSYIAYLLSSRYRQVYRITLDQLEELTSWQKTSGIQ